MRTQLMRNRFAGEILNQLAYFKEHGVAFHTQIVLCPELNDGGILIKTVNELLALAPATLSIAIVPVGLTKFRDNLPQLRVFSSTECREVIRAIEPIQMQCRADIGRTFVYLADEFYINAQLPVPAKEYYDDFSQLENGIGLTRVFLEEWQDTKVENAQHGDKFLIVTGKSASYVVSSLVDEFNALYASEHLVYGQKNNFFGDKVTVTGLLTAQDIAEALRNNPTYTNVVIPEVCLRKGEEIFLDNITWTEFKNSFADKNLHVIRGGSELKKLLAGGIRK